MLLADKHTDRQINLRRWSHICNLRRWRRRGNTIFSRKISWWFYSFAWIYRKNISTEFGETFGKPAGGPRVFGIHKSHYTVPRPPVGIYPDKTALSSLYVPQCWLFNMNNNSFRQRDCQQYIWLKRHTLHAPGLFPKSALLIYNTLV